MVSLVRERADGKHVQSSDGGVTSYERVVLVVLDSISGTRLDPELLHVSRQFEFRFHELAGREQRGCQATGVSIEIVWERAQKMGSDSARKFRVIGMARVCVMLLFSNGLTWRWLASGLLARKTLGRIESSLPGRFTPKE